MAKAAGDPQAYLSHISLIGRGGGAFKLLRGFDKSRHTVPDAVNSATSGFLAKLAAPELAAEAEDVFQRAKAALGYKRKDLSLDVTSPVAVLAARDFTLEIAYALEEGDPGRYAITRTLHGLRSASLVEVPAFGALFAAGFTGIVFALVKGVSVEAVIDAVETLDEGAGLQVAYPSDCRDCTLSVEGVNAEVICDGATLEMRFPRAGSPRELMAEFVAVRAAFALTKDKALRGLLG
jgi:hypothetical protein